MQKIIEFADKVALNDNPSIPDINKVKDTDINEIKSVVNGSLQGTNAMGSIVVDDINCKNMFDKGSFVAGDRKDAQPTIRISSRQVLYLEPGTYTFSTDLDTSVYRYEINTISSPAPVSSYDVLYGSGWKTTSTLTITIDNSTKGYFNLGVARINNSSLTISDISSANFQLEKGSTATNYVSYKQPVKKTSIGVKENCTFYADDFKCKNLFGNYVVINGWIDGTTMRVNSTNGNRMAFIPCQPNTTYTISRSVITSSFRVSDYTTIPSMTSSNVDYTIPTATKNDSGTTITYTTSSTAKYIIIHYANIGSDSSSTIESSLATMQLEVGGQTPYTPYKNFDGEIYSTEEAVVGRWIDGKPLYRKSVVVETLAYSTANQEYALMTISNLKDVISFKGTLWNSARTYQYALPYYNNNNYSKLLYKTNGKVYFQSSDTWSNTKIIAIVEYIKTTD